MGDPETLRQFLLDNVQRFPAKHYALFISGHGAAFGGQSIVHHPEGRIHNEKLAEVLADVSQQTGKKFALVNLNTCFGANLETLYPLRNVADAAVGSQGTIFAGTQPFVAVLKDIQDGVKEGLQLSGADVARLCVEESRRQPLGNLFTETLSAVDLTQLQNVADAVKGLQDALATAEQETLREAWKASHRIDYSSIPRQVWVTDVASFADEVGKRISDDAVRAAVKQVREAVDAAVVAETHADSNRETVTSRAMRFGFGKREQDLSRLSGLTFYLDDEAFAKGSRLQLINQSEYGADGRPEAFMKHLSGGRPEPTPLQRALNTIKEKHAVVEQKAVQALRIPQVVPIAERVLLGAGMLGGLRALSHFGIPAYSVGFGSYFAIRGTLGVINGTRD
ncbi:MAG: hypothetical protein FJX76_26435, partial [Armatimonadetes bacterium]|nr:hypothetical protein [Armatimonadota bacterium]